MRYNLGESTATKAVSDMQSMSQETGTKRLGSTRPMGRATRRRPRVNPGSVEQATHTETKG